MLTPTSLTGKSVAARAIDDEASTIAAFDIRVLITGEEGVGKQTIARLVHERSQRADRPFITIDCGALPDATFEPDWLEYHTGPGNDGGTLFIRCVDEMNADKQAALNRYLESVFGDDSCHQGEPPRRGRLRVLAAARSTLFDAVEAGTFRQDLFYRLNTAHIPVPPLRERFEDVPVLFDYFVQEVADVRRCTPPRVTPEMLSALTAYSWPGNVRELKLVATRFVMNAGEGRVTSPSSSPRTLLDGITTRRPLRPRPADITSMGRPRPHVIDRPPSAS